MLILERLLKVERIFFELWNSPFHLVLNFLLGVSPGGCDGIKRFGVVLDSIVNPSLPLEVLKVQPFVCWDELSRFNFVEQALHLVFNRIFSKFSGLVRRLPVWLPMGRDMLDWNLVRVDASISHIWMLCGHIFEGASSLARNCGLSLYDALWSLNYFHDGDWRSFLLTLCLVLARQWVITIWYNNFDQVTFALNLL